MSVVRCVILPVSLQIIVRRVHGDGLKGSCWDLVCVCARDSLLASWFFLVISVDDFEAPLFRPRDFGFTLHAWDEKRVELLKHILEQVAARDPVVGKS